MFQGEMKGLLVSQEKETSYSFKVRPQKANQTSAGDSAYSTDFPLWTNSHSKDLFIFQGSEGVTMDGVGSLASLRVALADLVRKKTTVAAGIIFPAVLIWTLLGSELSSQKGNK